MSDDEVRRGLRAAFLARRAAAEQAAQGRPETIAAAQRALRRPRSRKTFAALAAVAVLVAGGAVAGGLALADGGPSAKPGVMIGGLSVAGYGARELTAAVHRLADAAQVTVAYEDQVERASLADLGVRVDVAATVDDALQTDAGAVLVSEYTGWVKRSVPLDLKSDPAALAAWVGARFATGLAGPVDAAIQFDEATARYTVAPGEDGQAFALAPLQAALEALAWTPEDRPTARLRLERQAPAIGSAAAVAAADAANQAIGLTLRFADGAGGAYVATPADIAGWLAVKPDPAAGRIDVVRDATAFDSGLRARLTAALTAAPEPRRVVAGAQGETLAVAAEGRPGIAVGDLDDTVAATATALDHSLGVDLTVPSVQAEPPTLTGHLAAGPAAGKWIDVDLTSQTTTLVENGRVVASYVVSSGKAETPTPTGKYAVYLKVPSQTMRGTEPDGAPYAIPNVTWVTYFSGDYGFHTAYWLDDSQLGTPQSHGCLNMREAESRFIFDWAPMGA
ncbi:MAG: L,D-transpeptidase, partial [Propionibacteriaceae bacterium]|nr:L,D-transpeptidase [Propionibacteriaceae bacterium]